MKSVYAATGFQRLSLVPLRRCASALIVVLFAVCASGQTKEQVAVESVRFPNHPVEITGFEVNGAAHKLSETSPHKFEASFDAPEDWLRSLVVKIKNTTDKTIVAVELQTSLTTGIAGEIPMGAYMQFGQNLDESRFTGRAPRGELQSLSAGDTGEVRRTATEYEQLVKNLSHKHPANNYRRMRVDVREVRFDDNTVWTINGLFRIDPIDPRKWTPMDAASDRQPKLPDLNANEKIIIVYPQPQSPEDAALRLTSIKVAGQTITPERAFTAGEDWLRTLSLRIENTSTKPITSVRVSLNFPEAKHRSGTVAMSLHYGKEEWASSATVDQKPLMPGEATELTFTDASYERGRAFVVKLSGVSELRYLRLGTAVVMFADGTRAHVRNLFKQSQIFDESGSKQR